MPVNPRFTIYKIGLQGAILFMDKMNIVTEYLVFMQDPKDLRMAVEQVGQEIWRAENDDLKLSHISLASFLWDPGKQNSPICDATKCHPKVAVAQVGQEIWRAENDDLRFKLAVTTLESWEN